MGFFNGRAVSQTGIGAVVVDPALVTDTEYHFLQYTFPAGSLLNNTFCGTLRGTASFPSASDFVTFNFDVSDGTTTISTEIGSVDAFGETAFTLAFGFFFTNTAGLLAQSVLNVSGICNLSGISGFLYADNVDLSALDFNSSISVDIRTTDLLLGITAWGVTPPYRSILVGPT